MTRLLSLLAVGLLGGMVRGDDWPHWRGPTRNGLTGEHSGWQGEKWVSSPIWQANVGEGATSPIVVGEKIYTLGHASGRDTVWCLEAKTGKEIWKISYVTPRYARYHVGDQVFYAGPCSTPEYDAETGALYTLSLDGDLQAWDTTRQGKKLWGINLYDKYQAGRRPKVGSGGQQRDYGYTSSPAVWKDWLLVEVGGKDGNLAAFDKRTGKRVWVSRCQDLAGHTGGPAFLSVEGIPCVAVLTLTNLVVIRLDQGHEGETMGQYSWATEFANNIASPSVHEDSVLITSAYNKNAICKLRVTSKGITRVWEARYPSKACTPVIHRGRVYFAWQKVRCLDFATGKLLWEGGFVGDPGSCVVTADDRLVVWGQNGRLLLLETGDRYHELGKQERLFATHAWPHVVIASGRIVCKDRRGNLKCFTTSRGK